MQFALVAGTVATVLLVTYAGILYVYRDAPRRGEDPGQWSGIVAVTAGLGFLAYLLVRDDVVDPDATAQPVRDGEVDTSLQGSE